MMRQLPFLFVSFLLAGSPVFAQEYPDMVGVWKGHIRTVSSGAPVDSQVARDGAIISEMDVKVTIDYQDGETYIGKVRDSLMGKNDRSIPVWGAIRSNGKEAMFIIGTGGRGNLWFMGPNKFEYCASNVDEGVVSAYCGILEKET